MQTQDIVKVGTYLSTRADCITDWGWLTWESFMRKKVRKVKECIRKGDVLLDLGCGAGILISLTHEIFDHSVGVDLSTDVTSFCNEKLGFLPNVDMIRGDVNNIDFLRPNSVDCVIMTDILEHTIDPSIVLKTVYRLLRPGGQAIITVPNWYDSVRWFIPHCRLRKAPGHTYSASSYGWRKLLRLANFSIDKITCVYMPILGDNSVLCRMFHIIGASVIISATKPSGGY